MRFEVGVCSAWTSVSVVLTRKMVFMKAYIDLAEQYFSQFEGRQLYPGYLSLRFWFWVMASIAFAVALEEYMLPGHIKSSRLAILLAAEIVWLAASFCMSAWKDKQAILAVNKKLGTQFKTRAECKRGILAAMVPVKATEYQAFVKNLSEARKLRQEFKKPSDSAVEEIWRGVYDRDSKSRLLALMLAATSMVVALTAKSNSNLDALFDLYSEPAVARLFYFIELAVVAIFFIIIGVKIIALSIADVATAWAIKIIGRGIFSGWLISYLARDLLEFHVLKIDELYQESSNEPMLHKIFG